MATKAKVAKSKLKAAEIAALYAQLAAERPDPRTELDYTDPYTLVVAVALSAQATDVGVNKATKRLFAVADTPEKMVALGEEGVANYIKTIGLFNAKAANVIAGIRSVTEDGSSAKRTPSQFLPAGYEVTDCSTRVVRFMLSTISRHHEWAGIRKLG
jgi:endonuclease-3